MDPNQPNQQFPQTPGADQPQQQVPTPEPMHEQVPQFQTIYAGFWVRYAAFQIDIFPVAIIIALLSRSSFNILGSWIVIVIFFLYSTIFTFLYGATLGKKLFRLKVVDKNGNKPNFIAAVLRETGKLIFTVVFLVGFLWVVFDKEKQGLYDKIASTHVVFVQPLVGFRKVLVSIFRILFVLQIVIAVLGIVAAIFLIAVNPARRQGQANSVSGRDIGVLDAVNPAVRQWQARDSTRQLDIGQIRAGLDSYQSKNNKFPPSLDNLVTDGDLKEVPSDPLGGKYQYLVSSDSTSVALFAWLEKNKNATVWCWRSKIGVAQEIVLSSLLCNP